MHGKIAADNWQHWELITRMWYYWLLASAGYDDCSGICGYMHHYTMKHGLFVTFLLTIMIVFSANCILVFIFLPVYDCSLSDKPPYFNVVWDTEISDCSSGALSYKPPYFNLVWDIEISDCSSGAYLITKWGCDIYVGECAHWTSHSFGTCKEEFSTEMVGSYKFSQWENILSL